MFHVSFDGINGIFGILKNFVIDLSN